MGAVASAGDNAFACLLDDPAVVVAVDMSATQLALCALKKTAIQKLDGPTLRRFLGFDDDVLNVGAGFRKATYRALRGELPAAARGYFDANDDVVVTSKMREGGVWLDGPHCGFDLPMGARLVLHGRCPPLSLYATDAMGGRRIEARNEARARILA